MSNDTTGGGEAIASGPNTTTSTMDDSKDKGHQVNKGGKRDATVHLLDSSVVIFSVSKKAKGSALFEQVIAYVKLNEKDYFALSFTDQSGNKIWLYDDKKIAKQLKGRPWEFSFEVKFYPAGPTSLSDGLTRYLVCLQVRRDVHTGKIPATLATHAVLGSYVAQSERGDYEYSPEYEDFLRGCGLAPSVTQELLERVQLLHKLRKGTTPSECDMHYLENAAKLSMYGVALFPAKDSKGTPVMVGISAHGIGVYLEQIRIHRFVWQKIVKIVYSRNLFTVKLKPEEQEYNETTVVFKMPDYSFAKRLWKCAVEFHTFYRLIQPEEKPRRGVFRWASSKFRYEGRTQFQSKLASRMFDRPAPAVQRSESGRLGPRDEEDVLVKEPELPASPLHFTDDGTSRELNSPEKSYTVRPVDDSNQKEKESVAMETEVETGKGSPEKKDGTEKKDKEKKRKKSRKGDAQSSSASEAEEANESSISAPSGEAKEGIGEAEVVGVSFKGPSPFGDKVVLEEVVLLKRSEEAPTLPYHAVAESPNFDSSVESSTYDSILESASSKALPSPLTEDTIISPPVTTFDSRHETTGGPESVLTDVDQYGNIAKRGVKPQQAKHTVQHRTYMIVDEDTETYKSEEDSILESDVEDRVIIHSGDDIDHDAELDRAIMEATGLNPGMTVEKVEVKQELLH